MFVSSSLQTWRWPPWCKRRRYSCPDIISIFKCIECRKEQELNIPYFRPPYREWGLTLFSGVESVRTSLTWALPTVPNRRPLRSCPRDARGDRT